jgi:uncharacterized membrane protein YccC
VASLPSTVRRRVSGRFLPIVQTASAGVLAWLIAGLVTDDAQPTFAAIAAVICVGAAFGQRGQKAVNLIGGVVIGITVAAAVVHVIGSGPAQLGVMIVLAMLAAVVLAGDNDMVVVEAGVSAILIVTLDPGGAGEGIFSLNRILEAMIGGGTALAVSSLLFPQDPALAAGRGGQAVFAALGRTVEGIKSGLAEGDAEVANAALADARAIDALVDEAHDALAAGREAAMLTPPGRGARPVLDRYERSLAQIDFAVRDTRVLARHAVRLVRAGDVPTGLSEAVGELGEAIWELAAAYDDPARAEEAGRHALAAAGRAAWAHAAQPERAPAELVGQVRSTAVDLIRAAELVSGMGVVEERPVAVERPTEELLAV